MRIGKLSGKIKTKVTGKIKRVIRSCYTGHGDRFFAVLYHSPHTARHPDGFFYRRGPAGSGHDVFYAGSGDGHDAHGRTDRHSPDADEKGLGRGLSQLYSGIHYHYFGTGSAGAGRAGAVGAQLYPDSGCGGRCGDISGGSGAENASRNPSVLYAAGPVSDGIYPGRFRAGGFYGGGVRLRRGDDRAYDSPVYHGSGHWFFSSAKR